MHKDNPHITFSSDLQQHITGNPPCVERVIYIIIKNKLRDFPICFFLMYHSLANFLIICKDWFTKQYMSPWISQSSNSFIYKITELWWSLDEETSDEFLEYQLLLMMMMMMICQQLCLTAISYPVSAHHTQRLPYVRGRRHTLHFILSDLLPVCGI